MEFTGQIDVDQIPTIELEKSHLWYWRYHDFLILVCGNFFPISEQIDQVDALTTNSNEI